MIALRTLAFILLAELAASGGQTNPARTPNFVVLIADDLGWRDVGYHKSDIRTPNIDRLSQAGVRLERYYVYPTCSPTRAGLLTGRNPSRFGILAPIAGRSTETLPDGTMTLARALKARGYVSALAGKWHLGLRPEAGPRHFGFDRSYGYFHGQIDPNTHLYKNGDRTWHRDDVLTDEKGHSTDLIAAEAVRFLETKREEPFLLWVAFSVPHHPLQEEEKWTAPYKDKIADPWRRLFAASVTHMDAAIGRIVDALDKSGKAGETLLLFTSDNGGQQNYNNAKTEYGGKFEPHTTLGDNRPLRDWKGSLYEGGVRVPAFVYWKGHLKPAALEAPISVLDWFPTFLRLAGGAPVPEWRIEGKDIWPLLAQETQTLPARTIYWNLAAESAIVSGDWKLILRPSGTELYNVSLDPKETKSLADSNPAKVEELKRLLAEQKKLDPR